MKIVVHPRVADKRPEIEPGDVLSAYAAPVASQPRLGTDPPQYAGIGVDGKGRTLEWVGAEIGDGDLLIYHCMPATTKMRRELGLEGKRRTR